MTVPWYNDTMKPGIEHCSETCVQGTSGHYLLWIDGVGGYQVLLSHRVTLGQVNAESPADVSLFADISRHHATINRDSEGYFLEALRKVTVNGRQVEKTFLRTGDRLTLGGSCQLVFNQPSPVSTSARLDIVSGHRLHKPVDAVLLMADTLILGPAPASHVVVEGLDKPIILYRVKDQLGIRYDGELTIDGKPHKQRGTLEAGSHVVADGVTMAFES